MPAKKKAVKRKPREWTRWAVIKDYQEHGVAFVVVCHQKMTKRGAGYVAVRGENQQVIRVRITEVVK